jgi:hypothetical protein
MRIYWETGSTARIPNEWNTHIGAVLHSTEYQVLITHSHYVRNNWRRAIAPTLQIRGNPRWQIQIPNRKTS